jgi:hypothetical protein
MAYDCDLMKVFDDILPLILSTRVVFLAVDDARRNSRYHSHQFNCESCAEQTDIQIVIGDGAGYTDSCSLTAIA